MELKFRKVIAHLLTFAILLSVLPFCISAEEISGALEFPNSGFENGEAGSVPEEWQTDLCRVGGACLTAASVKTAFPFT